MKIRHFQKTRLLATIIAPIILVSCADEFDAPSVVPDAGRLPLEFSASIEQDNTSRADESGFADGDRFGTFVVNYDAGEPGTLTLSDNQVNNVAVTFDAESATWSTATEIYWRDSQTPADVYGYYPFNNGLADVEAYSFEVAADQSVPGSDGDLSAYEASDFLWAMAPRVTPGTKIVLPFTHRLAGVKVVLEKGTGFTDEEWAKLPRIITVDNTLRRATVDLSTGTASVTGAFDRNVVMNPDAADSYRAVVVPQQVVAGKSTIGLTIDGVNYAYTRDGGITYAAGKLHSFNLRVDKKEQSGGYTVTLTGESILPWEADSSSHDFEANSYLVVNCPASGGLEAAIAETGSDATTVKNLKVTGQMGEADFEYIRTKMTSITAVNVKEVTIPDRVYIGGFGGSEDDFMENALPSWAFHAIKTLRRLILPDGIKGLGQYSVAGIGLNSTLIIPESVTHIFDCAFEAFGEDGTIVLPNSLEYIGGCAFYASRAKFELKLPATLKFIGGAAFYDCEYAYGTFSLPPKLEFIGDEAFMNCGSKGGLTGDIIIPEAITEVPRLGVALPRPRVVFHENITKIKGGAFAGTRFNGPVKFPDNLQRIDANAFVGARFAGEVKLPKNIKFIDGGAFARSNFSGRLEYPETMTTVKGGEGTTQGAFVGTSISELIIGDNVLQIEYNTFYGNNELRYIELGKNVSFIGENAFSSLPQLEKFVILAKEPPTAFASTFDDLYYDKVVLEVPEGSVDAYRNAEGWKRFLNITAHRELAFNIPDIACLDRGVTRTGILRAEGPWHVSGCPDWVHVSPMSGDYKDEITITVDSQSVGAESREGLIEFTLDGKDYTTSASVRQLATPDNVGEDTEIILQTASARAPAEIPVFIVGEGFTADQIVSGDYMTRMEQTMNDLFAIEPYKSMSNYFTVSTSFACSPDEGTGDVETIKVNCFDTDGISPDITKLRDYVTRVSPTHAGGNLPNALIIVVCNYNAFAGWSSIEDDGCSIAGIGITDDIYPYDQRGLVQHHAGGAAFAGLGNEGVSHFHHIKGCPCPACSALGRFTDMKGRAMYENLTMSGKMNDAPWREFIFHPKYSLMVDMWEGGYDHIRGVWRSESQSVMGTYISYYNTISRYAIYKGIMRRAGLTASLDEFIANDKIEIPY